MLNFQIRFTDARVKWGFIFPFAAALVLMQASRQSKAQVSQEIPEAVSLSVSVLVAEVEPTLGPTLVFQATNNSKKDLTLDDAGLGGSPIIIIKPNGEQVFSVAAVTRIPPLPVLKPGESASRRLNLFDMFSRERLKEPGVYKLYWKTTLGSSQNQYTSNQILVLRDKKTPYRDPDTREIITP